MHTHPHYRHRCTACGASVKRVPRHAGEKTETGHASLRRYACTGDACNWQGLLPRQRTRTTRRRLLRRWQRGLRPWHATLALMAGLSAAVAAVLVNGVALQAAPPPLVPLGETREGTLLPVSHALVQHHALGAAAASSPAAAGPVLTLRRHCVWGRPGGDPYRGTVEQALRSAALPEEVVSAIASQVAAGLAVDQLEITNEGVRASGSGRVFDAQHIAMTHGMTLCLSTRVNFVAGHVEKAALYEAADARGHVVAVMVPKVCGNVSVLGQRGDGRRNKVLQARGEADPGFRWMPAVLDAEPAGPGLPVNNFTVPEPGTLACVLGALGLLGWLRLRKRF